MNKFEMQDNQYLYPYHHIPYIEENSKGKKVVGYRTLEWSIEYMTYMNNIASIISKTNCKSILDVGCGDGKFFTLLDKSIRKVGCDMSRRSILFAKAFNPDCEFICGDFNELKEKFDIVTAIEVLEHIPNNKTSFFLKGLLDRINEKGAIYLQVPTDVIPCSKKHYKHYNIEILTEELIKCEVNYNIEEVHYIMKKSKFYNLVKKLIFRKYFILRVGTIDRFLWNYANKKLKIATANNGTHMLVKITKCNNSLKNDKIF